MLLYYLSGIIFLLVSFLCMNLSMILLIFKKTYFFEWQILMINSFVINMFLYIDWMSLMFVFTILLISSMIMFYSSEYMIHDNSKNRFFYLVFMFIISMLMMILSPNLISILIGWDGLGLISYCLVIYYQSYSSFNSGMLTVLMNRIGDVLILLSLGMMMMFGSWNFMNMNYLMKIILLMVILASFTKSAQFPFSSWLPAAMAAPTPVSSLVHSSTLVTAGVFLMIRFHYLIFKFEYLLFYIFISGLITMMLAGFSANFEYDLKKVIAYSTLSQLGLMMMIIGTKNFELSYFHLVIHAMFKSMMFMCSGVMIHSMMNYQDIRFMGMLNKMMPLTSMIFMVSNFSLCGMPFFSGFYSKDQILEYMMMNNMNLLNYLFMIIGTLLTVSYSVRFSYYLMNNSLNNFPMNNINDFKMMNFPMLLLFIFTVIYGSYMNWLMFSMIEEIYMSMLEKMLILILCFIIFLLNVKLCFLNSEFKKFYFLKFFLGKMWFLYYMNLIIIKSFLNYSIFIFKIIDKGYMEFFMKNSMYDYSIKLNMLFMKVNINYLMNFLLMITYLMMLIMIFY
uniref:NADH-ubiquinone oxidoreductase chain 5 n=1 Tax=Eurytoma sp. ZJUH_2016013 TaxID=2491157 RepID=A0A3Q8U9R9_9HYME|nr:NADH dehydrogenase subunit 5 [Eurytoma sp. ZJUH_2016013]